MSRHMKVGADGKIPYLPPLEFLGKAACSGFVVGCITTFVEHQFFAEAKSALLKESLFTALGRGSRYAYLCSLYFTVEQSMAAARGKAGPLNSFVAGAVVGALNSSTDRPSSVCASALVTGSAAAIGQLIVDQLPPERAREAKANIPRYLF